MSPRRIAALFLVLCVVVGVLVARDGSSPQQSTSDGRRTSPTATTAQLATTPAGLRDIRVPPQGVTASPAEQAKHIVAGSYGDIETWVRVYRERWGTTPHQAWTVRRITDTRWIARLTITGSPDHRVTASWTLDTPLGPHPTVAQVRAFLEDESLPEPRDATARSFTQPPPVPPARFADGTIKLRVMVITMTPRGSLEFDPSSEAVGVDPTASSTSDGIKRGLKLTGLGESAFSLLHVPPSVHLVRTHGKTAEPASLAELRQAGAAGLFAAEFTWNAPNPQPHSLRELLRQPVSSIRWDGD